MKVYTIADHIISALGAGSRQHFNAMLRGEAGIKKIEAGSLSPEPFYGAYAGEYFTAGFPEAAALQYTRLEKAFINAIQGVLQQVPGMSLQKTVLVLSSTKGNIDLMGATARENIPAERLQLGAMARAINDYFALPDAPVLVSNACISGASAILVAQKLIRSGRYAHALVVGGDLLDEFIISGFQSLKAMSDEACRPYDAHRKGINLGEAVGCLLLSRDKQLGATSESFSELMGGGQSNDANHISGPSRTGKGLKLAVQTALGISGLPPESLGYINAHGTATLFNDEMEAIAFSDLSLGDVPLNSLKGYLGHTLGAAGVVESILAIWQLNTGKLLASPGYVQSGVSRPLNVLQHQQEAPSLTYALKTVSGFGGCNAALIFAKAQC